MAFTNAVRTQITDIRPNPRIKVNKINFDINRLLLRSCEGTFFSPSTAPSVKRSNFSNHFSNYAFASFDIVKPEALHDSE